MNKSPSRFLISHRRHLATANTLQTISFHLKDALPRIQMHDLLVQMERNTHTPEELKENKWKFILQKQLWLDEGYGECLLRDPQLATIVKDKIYYDDHGSYDVIGWTILANHVHIILYLRENNLSEIMQKIKAYSAKEINIILGRQGQSFWDSGYFDRQILSLEHFEKNLENLKKQPGKCQCSDKFTGIIPNADYYKQVFSAIPALPPPGPTAIRTWSASVPEVSEGSR